VGLVGVAFPEDRVVEHHMQIQAEQEYRDKAIQVPQDILNLRVIPQVVGVGVQALLEIAVVLV
jgi:hypothetical protein